MIIFWNSFMIFFPFKVGIKYILCLLKLLLVLIFKIIIFTIYFINRLFDTPEDRYRKLRQKVSDITCIQLGLAIFTYDINNKTYKANTYSFYTYPQTFYKCDSIVNFQTSCVEFLCKHKFDFNKVNIMIVM